MRLRPRTSTADSESSSTAPYGSLRQRQQSLRHRRSVDDSDIEEPVDAMAMSRMMAQVAQQGGEVDRALEQVCRVWGQYLRYFAWPGYITLHAYKLVMHT